MADETCTCTTRPDGTHYHACPASQDPAVWVLLPNDTEDLQYDMEPLVACLNEEAAKEHREADERVVRYVPEDAYREQAKPSTHGKSQGRSRKA